MDENLFGNQIHLLILGKKECLFGGFPVTTQDVSMVPWKVIKKPNIKLNQILTLLHFFECLLP